MTDIVERLRVWPAAYGEDALSSTYVGAVMKDAAEEIERLRAALAPFAGDKIPGLRKSEIDFDRNGLRRCISPMEIACRDARRALPPSERNADENTGGGL